MRSTPDSVPALWLRLPERWEYGHVAGFALQLLGLVALVVSVVLETPDGQRRRVAARDAKRRETGGRSRSRRPAPVQFRIRSS